MAISCHQNLRLFPRLYSCFGLDMLKRFFTFTFAFQMTSVDACGVTFVFKHNYLPLLTGVLNLQIGFASPKMTVNFFFIAELLARAKRAERSTMGKKIW